jgi:hypothetical protein
LGLPRCIVRLYPVPKLGKRLLERDTKVTLGFRATFRHRRDGDRFARTYTDRKKAIALAPKGLGFLIEK